MRERDERKRHKRMFKRGWNESVAKENGCRKFNKTATA